jgi:transposase-like protein
MSLLSERQKTHDLSMHVSCPRCDAPMKIKTIEPSMVSPGLDEIIYRCPSCTDERKQTVMRRAVYPQLG